MNESILNSIKKLLGIHNDDKAFDTDIIIHINTVLNTLTQLGIGPEEGFTVADDKAIWTDFINDSKKYSKTALDFSPEWLYTDVSKGR